MAHAVYSRTPPAVLRPLLALAAATSVPHLVDLPLQSSPVGHRVHPGPVATRSRFRRWRRRREVVREMGVLDVSTCSSSTSAQHTRWWPMDAEGGLEGSWGGPTLPHVGGPSLDTSHQKTKAIFTHEATKKARPLMHATKQASLYLSPKNPMALLHLKHPTQTMCSVVLDY